MNKKFLILLVSSLAAAFALGFGGIWFLLADKPHAKKSTTTESARKHAPSALTTTVDFFQLTMPCRHDADGNTPIAHADFQFVVPLDQRIKIEEKTSRLRDIIATLLRNSDAGTLNRDMESFKQEIIRQARRDLGLEITEILVLRFDYDILRARR